MTNENGTLLTDWILSNNMKLSSSYFRMKENRRWTWISPDGSTKNEIDHVLINDLRIVKGYQILGEGKFPSDHRCLRMKLQTERRCRLKNYKRADRKAKKIIPVSMVNTANDIIKKKLIDYGFEREESVQNKYNILEKAILETNEEVGVVKKEVGTNEKISQDTKKLIKQRDKMRRQLKINEPAKTNKIRIECAELNKLVKKAIRRDIVDYENSKIMSLVEESETIRKIKIALNESRNIPITKIKRVDGSTTISNYDEVFHAETALITM